MLGYYRRNWYYLAGAAVVATAALMVVGGHLFSPIQAILIYSFMALLVHQFEEYALPGGEPAVLNVVFYGEKRDYDRYPGNRQNAMIVNTLAYPFYLAPIVFPDLIWLGLAQMFFGFFQFVGHGIVMNVRGRSWYNPGLASVVLLHVPIGIWYIHFVLVRALAGWTDFMFGALAFVLATALLVVAPVQLLKDRKSPYPFSREELERFDMLDKLKRRGVL